jgi:hypothetical protein
LYIVPVSAFLTSLAYDIRLEVIKLSEARKGFVLLPRRRVVERSFGCMSRFRRPDRDYERWLETLRGLHFLDFAMLMTHRFVRVIAHIAGSVCKPHPLPPPRIQGRGSRLA